MQRLLIVTVTVALVAIVGSAAGASKPIKCNLTPHNQNGGIVFVTQATGMTCAAALKDVGPRTIIPGKSFRSPGGFACLRKSTATAKTLTYSCRKATKAYKFEIRREG